MGGRGGGAIACSVVIFKLESAFPFGIFHGFNNSKIQCSDHLCFGFKVVTLAF